MLLGACSSSYSRREHLGCAAGDCNPETATICAVVIAHKQAWQHQKQKAKV